MAVTEVAMPDQSIVMKSGGYVAGWGYHWIDWVWESELAKYNAAKAKAAEAGLKGAKARDYMQARKDGKTHLSALKAVRTGSVVAPKKTAAPPAAKKVAATPKRNAEAAAAGNHTVNTNPGSKSSPRISLADAAAQMYGKDSPQHKKALADEKKNGPKYVQNATPAAAKKTAAKERTIAPTRTADGTLVLGGSGPLSDKEAKRVGHDMQAQANQRYAIEAKVATLPKAQQAKYKRLRDNYVRSADAYKQVTGHDFVPDAAPAKTAAAAPAKKTTPARPKPASYAKLGAAGKKSYNAAVKRGLTPQKALVAARQADRVVSGGGTVTPDAKPARDLHESHKQAAITKSGKALATSTAADHRAAAAAWRKAAKTAPSQQSKDVMLRRATSHSKIAKYGVAKPAPANPRASKKIPKAPSRSADTKVPEPGTHQPEFPAGTDKVVLERKAQQLEKMLNDATANGTRRATPKEIDKIAKWISANTTHSEALAQQYSRAKEPSFVQRLFLRIFGKAKQQMTTKPVTKRQFSSKQRATAAAKGIAMPDGSYPIANAADLRNAIDDMNRTNAGPDVKKHILKRAKALGITTGVSKRDDTYEFRVDVPIHKMDEQGIAFGWAQIAVRKDGRIVLDKQGDFVADIEELEKAAYGYVLNHRNGDVMHNGEAVATMVESMVFTPEKLEKMGLAPDALPLGWWLGLKINDPVLRDDVRTGKFPMFSVGGTGRREYIDI